MINQNLKARLTAEVIKKEKRRCIPKQIPLFIGQIFASAAFLKLAYETLKTLRYSYRQPNIAEIAAISALCIGLIALCEAGKRYILKKSVKDIEELKECEAEDAYISGDFLILKRTLKGKDPAEIRIYIPSIKKIDTRAGRTVITYGDIGGGETSFSFLDYFEPQVASQLGSTGYFRNTR